MRCRDEATLTVTGQSQVSPRGFAELTRRAESRRIARCAAHREGRGTVRPRGLT